MKYTPEDLEYFKNYDPKAFPVILNTVDAVVIRGDEILMVKRAKTPGKGFLALPGGFLNYDERIHDGIIRELQEETTITVSDWALHRQLGKVQYFDYLFRDGRGRCITHAGLIELSGYEARPEVLGADDALVEGTQWYPISYILANYELIFADHHHIITEMLKHRKSPWQKLVQWFKPFWS